MKLLITGARGQLGSELPKTCRDRGIEVSALGREELDITDLTRVREVVGEVKPTAIVNCAAYNAVDQAEREFERACRVNALGPRNLAAAAEEAGIPLMHFSTDYVFDGEKGGPYATSDPPNPISRYGESKLRGEEAVRSTTGRFFVVRLSWVFGSGSGNFPRKLLRWADEKGVVRVVTDQTSSPSSTADLAPAILHLLGTGAYGLYHLCNQGRCSRYEWAKFILERARPGVEVVPASRSDFAEPARRPRFSALEPSPLVSATWEDATERFLRGIDSRS